MPDLAMFFSELVGQHPITSNVCRRELACLKEKMHVRPDGRRYSGMMIIGRVKLIGCGADTRQ